MDHPFASRSPARELGLQRAAAHFPEHRAPHANAATMQAMQWRWLAVLSWPEFRQHPWRTLTAVIAIALGKSTYARCGIVVNVTPLEPGWEGHVTLEISNTTPLPAKVYAGEGIVQLLFLEGPRPEVTYRDRKGTYQGQKGITLPRV